MKAPKKAAKAVKGEALPKIENQPPKNKFQEGLAELRKQMAITSKDIEEHLKLVKKHCEDTNRVLDVLEKQLANQKLKREVQQLANEQGVSAKLKSELPVFLNVHTQ